MDDILYLIEDFVYLVFEFDSIAILLAIGLVTLWVLRKLRKKHYHSHWRILIEGLEYSPQVFYQSLKAHLFERQIPEIQSDFVTLSERHFFSSRRRYLRVSYRDFFVDICLAPFGKATFCSWWCIYRPSLAQYIVSFIPIIGGWLEKSLFPVTYYKIDTASMFMTATHYAILGLIDEISQDKGIKPITIEDRKPILHDVFDRKKS
jgi:hypothetical protein